MDLRAFSPPIQSIWIEEDQFMEKIYGFQVDQLLEPDTNSNSTFRNEMEDKEEQRARILIINSDTPLLGNKSNIQLKKTAKFLDRKNSISIKYNKNRNVSFSQRLLNILKKNDIIKRVRSEINERNSSNAITPHISAPFQFQHISHGEDQIKTSSESISDTSTHVQETEATTLEDYDDTTETTFFSTMTSKTSVAFSAFCTPQLNCNSVNSSKIFDLERKDESESLSSPTTLVATSTFRQSVHY